MTQQAAKWIIIAGFVLIGIGLIWYFLGDKLQWVGRLPGDIKIERENFTFYFPLTTMILLSVLLTFMIRLVQRFL